MKKVSIFLIPLFVVVACGTTSMSDLFHTHGANGEVLVGKVPDNTPPNTDNNAPSVPGFPQNATLVVNAGQETGSLTTYDTPIQGTVGGTLTVVNNSAQNITIHTGGAPFPHTNAVKPGATMVFNFVKPIRTSQVGNQTYRHELGPSARLDFDVRNP